MDKDLKLIFILKFHEDLKRLVDFYEYITELWEEEKKKNSQIDTISVDIEKFSIITGLTVPLYGDQPDDKRFLKVWMEMDDEFGFPTKSGDIIKITDWNVELVGKIFGYKKYVWNLKISKVN